MRRMVFLSDIPFFIYDASRLRTVVKTRTALFIKLNLASLRIAIDTGHRVKV
jgi:hypothetical protein